MPALIAHAGPHPADTGFWHFLTQADHLAVLALIGVVAVCLLRRARRASS